METITIKIEGRTFTAIKNKSEPDSLYSEVEYYTIQVEDDDPLFLNEEVNFSELSDFEQSLFDD